MRHLRSFVLLQLLFAAFVASVVTSAACSSRHRHAPVSSPTSVAPSSSLRDSSVLEDTTHVVGALSVDVTTTSDLSGQGLHEDRGDVVLNAPDALTIKGVSRCRDNLCGGEYGESYCSCNGPHDNARCWSMHEDCEVDAKCCDDRPGYCNGLRIDDCADATAKARKARDAKAAKP